MAGGHVQSSRGIAGVILALLLLLGGLVNACQDQPVDGSGVTVIRDTIRISRDSVVIRDSIVYKDSVVIRDSVFYRDSIVLRDSTVVRDTVIVRDSVRFIVKDSVRYDTVIVPENTWRIRKATLHYQGQNDSAGNGAPQETIEVNVTDWLQYTVVDSNNVGVVALGLSMSAAIPPKYANYSSRNNAFSFPVYLRGFALHIPLFRMSRVQGFADTLVLQRHPYEWLSGDNRDGGMMISVETEEAKDILQVWTGKVIEPSIPPNNERLVSRGVLRINRVDTQRRIVVARIESVFYVLFTAGGREIIESISLSLDIEMGY